MPHDGQEMSRAAPVMEGLLEHVSAVIAPLDTLLAAATDRVRATVSADGKVQAALLEEQQRAAHGLAWLATYVEAIRQMQAWAGRLQAEGSFGRMEALLLQIGFGEYLCQIYGGVSMSQGEIARLQDLRLTPDAPGAAAAGAWFPAGSATSGRVAWANAAVARAMGASRIAKRFMEVSCFYSSLLGAGLPAPRGS